VAVAAAGLAVAALLLARLGLGAAVFAGLGGAPPPSPAAPPASAALACGGPLLGGDADLSLGRSLRLGGRLRARLDRRGRGSFAGSSRAGRLSGGLLGGDGRLRGDMGCVAFVEVVFLVVLLVLFQRLVGG